MPTVPVIDQTANAVPQPQAGAATSTTGATIGDRLAAQVDDATVKSAESAALTQANGVLYDPQNGYLNQRGKNAIDQYDSAKQSVVKAFQDQLDGLSSPIQKQMFGPVMQQHLLTYGQQIATHQYDQTSQYSGETAVNRATTFANSASHASSSYGQTDADGKPTGDFAKNVGTAEQETLNAVQIMKGSPANSADANKALLHLHTQIAANTIAQMMDARAPYTQVQRVYDDMQSKNWLDDSQGAFDAKVKAYTDQESAQEASTQHLSDAYRASQGQPTSATGTPDYQFPVKGATITAQPYDPNDGGGVTLNVAKGTNIQAPANGKVLQTGKDEDGNFSMQIQHPDGSVTTFSGLNAANVKAGDQVQHGEVVATSGTQNGSTSPAVLWSLADKNGNAVDPTKAGLPPVDLSKITDEKVLGNALDSMRKQVTEPSLQQQTANEMVSTVRQNQQAKTAAEAQTYNDASNQFYSGGQSWRNIQPSTFNQLTPEQQQQFKDLQTQHVLQQYQQGQAFKSMNETDLVTNFIQNPKLLTPDNVNAARPNLANSTYATLLSKAQQLQQNPNGVAEAQAVNDRIRYFAGHAGVNVDPQSAADKQTLIGLTHKVQQDLDQIKAQNNGKTTPAQIDQAIQQELIQRAVTTPRSGLSPQIGALKTFPNGRIGKWDGQGWMAQ